MAAIDTSSGSRSSLSSGSGGGDSVVTEECVEELLEFFSRTAFRTKNVDRRVRRPTSRCGCLVFCFSQLLKQWLSKPLSGHVLPGRFNIYP